MGRLLGTAHRGIAKSRLVTREELRRVGEEALREDIHQVVSFLRLVSSFVIVLLFKLALQGSVCNVSHSGFKAQGMHSIIFATTRVFVVSHHDNPTSVLPPMWY